MSGFKPDMKAVDADKAIARGPQQHLYGAILKTCFIQSIAQYRSFIAKTILAPASVIRASMVDPAVPPRAAKYSPTVVPLCFQRFRQSRACSRVISMTGNVPHVAVAESFRLIALN